MRHASRWICLLTCLSAASFAGWAGQVWVLHSGDTNPVTSEGWGGPGNVDVAANAWQICCNDWPDLYDTYGGFPSIVGALTSASNFDLTVVMANLDASGRPEYNGDPYTDGANVEFSLNGSSRFDLNLSYEGGGNTALSLDPFQYDHAYSITGLGVGEFVTLDMLYSGGSVDVYVNGTLVPSLSGFTGHNNFPGVRLTMGASDGLFQLVRLQTDVSQVYGATVPEPASMGLIAVAGIVALAFRRRATN